MGVCGYQYLSGALRGAMASEEAVSAADGAGKAGEKRKREVGGSGTMPLARSARDAPELFEVRRPGSGPASLEECPWEVLFEDDEFLAINKPANVRLDRDFPVTVEKLVTKHTDLVWNKTCKLVHQLDYVTSGVLLLAKTREAANRAGEAFEVRGAQKCYTALVEGEVDEGAFEELDDTDADLDEGTAPDEVLGPLLVAESKRGRGKGHRRMASTQAGRLAQAKYKTASTFLFELNCDIRNKPEADRDEDETKLLKCKNMEHVRERVPEMVELLELAEANERERVQGPILKRMQERPAVYLRALGHWSEKLSDGLFSEVARKEGGSVRRVIIRAPLSPIPNDFRMAVATHGAADAKLALTEMQVLETGVGRVGKAPEGQEDAPQVVPEGTEVKVTAIRMYPRTGRRHQLRVHCALAGHPIVGDKTYWDFSRGVDHKSSEAMASLGLTTLSPRCALHAERLRIPGLLKDGSDLVLHAPNPFLGKKVDGKTVFELREA